MTNIEKIQQLQEISINVWPPKRFYFINGWILRLSEGVTGRANSVLPLRYLGSDLDKDIASVEEIYYEMNLDPKFMLHDEFQPNNLLTKLKSLNYESTNFSVVMGENISNLEAIKDYTKKFKITLSKTKSGKWKNFKKTYSHRIKKEQVHINRPEERILSVIDKRYLSVYEDNDKSDIIAIALVSLDKQGFIHIADLIVDKNYRRQNVATCLISEIIKWGKNKGHFLWLQVTKDNYSAVNLYKKIGLRKLYSYHYMTKKRFE